jgi:hypothetical protein
LWERDTSTLQLIPPVHHEFYGSLPREDTGKRKDGQKVITGEEKRMRLLIKLEQQISSWFVQRICILLPKYLGEH